jgi:hypothetical protein
VKGGAANNELGSTTFDKLWNLYSILLIFDIYFSLLKNLIWSIYVILVVLQSLATTLERDPGFWRCVKTYMGLYMWCIQGWILLHYLSLSCLKPKLIAARNQVFSQSKDFSTRHCIVALNLYNIWSWLRNNNMKNKTTKRWLNSMEVTIVSFARLIFRFATCD